AWGNAAGYHPAWVYHGLLVGTPAEAARFLDGLLTGRLLRPAQLQAMLTSRPLGGAPEGRPWRAPAYGLGLMTDVVPPARRCPGHTGAGPGGVGAAFPSPDPAPPRTTATFARGGDVGIVERAVLGLS